MSRYGVFTLLGLVLAAGGEAGEMSAPRVRFAHQGAWRIAYELREAGEPEASELPVVFVHGANSDRRVWRHQMAGLRWPGPLVAIDLLGYGESDKPEGADYGFDTLAGSVEAVLEALALERAILVAHSNGVPTARAFYRRFPDRTRALVLLDGALRAPLAPQMIDWMRQSLRRPDFADSQRQMMEQTPRGGLGDEDYALIQEAALATPPWVMASALDAMADPETWREDPIEVPVLMILAADSGQNLGSDENRAFAASLIPHLDFQVWEGVTHFFPLERPEELDRRVEAFLDGLGR